MQGVKLFYRVLESMLKAEQDRTGRSSFGSLLSSASFHKCLAACCFEVVIASYRMVSPPFCRRCPNNLQSRSWHDEFQHINHQNPPVRDALMT